MSEQVKDYPPYLDYPKPRKKQTNADKIRSMTDEELAVVLRDNCGNRECPPYHVTDLFPNDECLESCKMCWLDWLRREVEK